MEIPDELKRAVKLRVEEFRDELEGFVEEMIYCRVAVKDPIDAQAIAEMCSSVSMFGME